MASRKPFHKDLTLLRGADSKFLRNMHFVKKHNKKGLNKMQAKNTKAVSAGAEALKSREVKPKMPKGTSHKLDRPALLAHPKHGKCACAHMARDEGSAGQRQSPSPSRNSCSSINSTLGSSSCPQGCSSPCKCSIVKASVNVRTEGLV
ncbi:Hypothetical predicted protein [Marmota monax]|uniref:Uncharacterized protein n=1 Tax=Marmota monax TaxID=9995 RepID=A0A5E4DDB0_MARMO|nr:Hypothetical predicted protein [Marmota monax]